MSSPTEVRSILEGFLDDLNEKVDTHRLEELLKGEGTLQGPDVGSKPESWTRKHLIRPLLDASGLEWEPEIHGGGEGYPDFGITNLDILVIGEDKSINKFGQAEEEIQEYLNNRAASRGAEYGIATDGIQWTVYRIELGGDYLDYTPVNPTPINFREELLEIAQNKNYISQSGLEDVDVDEKTETFYEAFNRDSFNTLLTQEAPKRIREKKQAGIEEFYDLYVELLFGEGSGSHDYETTLLNDIKEPSTANETDKRRFAIRLVNRLLFVKFLEDREVLPQDFLTERVSNYENAQEEFDELGGSLYKTQLEPLFFSLFNADDRMSSLQGSWFDDVPYLNGSLFAPEEQERDYDVDDRMLITVVQDLVEGHQLNSENGEGGLDPSVLGNVFEMTINHISAGEAQKDEGAYYTPSDVIRLITEKSVDPKVYQILVDVYASRISGGSNMDEEDARSLVSNYELGEMLREIEQREGYFSDPEAIQEAYDKLGELKVIDPSCGSGHFLTGVLDEIHRVRMSLLRGLKGDNLVDKDVYQSKKDLVLNSIYGVDINPIAIEIAKLRVWLKMVEEGWEEEYGKLPNIDINIVDGNSLVGLPAKSDGQSVLQAFDIDLSGIRDIRDEYRDGDISRRELNNRIDELRPELREQYLDRLNHYIEERLSTESEWGEIVEGLEELYPKVRKITVRRADNEQLSNKNQNKLDDAGFNVESRYEKSAKVTDTDIDNVDDFTQFVSQEGLVFDVERRPVLKDLRELEALKHRESRLALSYEPFHWPLEFPEAVESNGNGYEVQFDIVVGNPPYGNVLEDVEKRFTEGYNAGSVNDIIAPFVEREAQILRNDGYLGNILALLIAYQSNAYPIRDVVRDNFKGTEIACFTRRPSQVFAGSQARTGVITGRKDADTDDAGIKTSRFIRFNENNREEVFRNISYESTEGLILGNKIDSGKDKSLPKIGDKTLRDILDKLKEHSDRVMRDCSSRQDETSHVVWRSRHPAYFINPCLENLYPDDDVPQDFDPLYFSTELERRTGFLLLQSSLFYMYWMVYENERDVNWKSIDTFPVPEEDQLREKEEKIQELSEKLWSEMSDRFKGGSREMIEQAGVVKPLADKADELFGSMFDLSEEEIKYVKEYDEQYRLNDVNQSQLVSADVDWDTEIESTEEDD